jgi:hypothetical protein
MVTVNDSIVGTAFRLPVQRPFPTFHWSKYVLTCPLMTKPSQMNKTFLILHPLLQLSYMMWLPFSSNLLLFKLFNKIWSTIDLEIPVRLANSHIVQCLSSSMHCQIMASDMSVWTDAKCSLQGMLAVDTLLLLNTCSHLARVQYRIA